MRLPPVRSTCSTLHSSLRVACHLVVSPTRMPREYRGCAGVRRGIRARQWRPTDCSGASGQGVAKCSLRAVASGGAATGGHAEVMHTYVSAVGRVTKGLYGRGAGQGRGVPPKTASWRRGGDQERKERRTVSRLPLGTSGLLSFGKASVMAVVSSSSASQGRESAFTSQLVKDRERPPERFLRNKLRRKANLLVLLGVGSVCLIVVSIEVWAVVGSSASTLAGSA